MLNTQESKIKSFSHANNKQAKKKRKNNSWICNFFFIADNISQPTKQHAKESQLQCAFLSSMITNSVAMCKFISFEPCQSPKKYLSKARLGLEKWVNKRSQILTGS